MLGLLCENQTHGWDLVRALRPDGEIGDVWACSRPLVYRAIDVLAAQELIEKRGSEESARRAGANAPRRDAEGPANAAQVAHHPGPAPA